MRALFSSVLVVASPSLLALGAAAPAPTPGIGEKQVESLLSTARDHMRAGSLRRGSTREAGSLVITYDLPGGGRFATGQVSPDGRLRQFSVNSPDDRARYAPIEKRRLFIRKMMRIVSPEIPIAEAEWAEAQLDDPVREWTPSFPIVAGDFVYRLYRANMHDHFEITSADANTPGWRFRKSGLARRRND